MARKSKAVHEKTKPLRQTPRRVILIVTIASGLAAIGWGLYGQLRPPAIPATATASSPSADTLLRPVRIGLVGREVWNRISRPVLLGSRDPRGPSCVTVVRSGDIRGIMPPHTGDPDGCPGTRLATLYLLDRLYCKKATLDFTWHQGRLKVYLENEGLLNRPAASLRTNWQKRRGTSIRPSPPALTGQTTLPPSASPAARIGRAIV